MVRRRGDNIPSVSDYSHWNEDAQYMWYQENKYDMEHWDEVIEDDDDYKNYEDEFGADKEFLLKSSAYKFAATLECDWAIHHWGNKWIVEYENDKQIKEKAKRHPNWKF